MNKYRVIKSEKRAENYSKFAEIMSTDFSNNCSRIDKIKKCIYFLEQQRESKTYALNFYWEEIGYFESKEEAIMYCEMLKNNSEKEEEIVYECEF